MCAESSSAPPCIRPAAQGDCAAILAYWNPLIRETTVTFSSEEKTEAGLWQMIAARRAQGQEFLLAEDGGGAVLGHATYGQFRAGNGYAHAMEHTIILAPAARGLGLGRALMAAIESHARAGGAHVMIGGVSAENAAGRAFHAAIGYREMAVLPQLGRKFDRWLDLVLMQKML